MTDDIKYEPPLSEERLAEIRERAAWTCRERGADIDALLIHVDHLTRERDEWKARRAALRADVERERGNLAQAGSTYAILRLDHILDHDDARDPQDQP